MKFQLRIHTYIMDEIIRQYFFFKYRKNLTKTATTPNELMPIFERISKKYQITKNDLPNPKEFHEKAKQVFFRI